MSYVICNNGYYLRKEEGKRYAVVTSIDKATKWDAANKVENICSRMQKDLRKYNLKPQLIKEENLPELSEDMEYDILDKVQEISIFVDELENRVPYLKKKIHEVDLEIVDIEHAAEFYNLNAAEGYKLYKNLHDARNKRRKYKDDLEKINYVLESSCKSKDMKNLQKRIVGLDNRKYKPRINSKLFKNKERMVL